MDAVLSAAWRALWCCCLLGLPFVALAQVPTVALTAAGGVVTAAPLSSLGSDFQRLVAGSVAGASDRLGSDATFRALLQRPALLGDVAVMDRAAVQVAGSNTAMGIIRTIPFSAVVRVGVKALPYVGAATTAYSAYAAYRTYKDPSGSNAAMQDDGQDAINSPAGTCLGYSRSLVGQPAGTLGCATLAQVCSFRAQYFGTTLGTVTDTYACGYGTQFSPGFWSAGYEYIGGPSSQPTAGTFTCPAFVDALNPSNSQGAGAVPGPDGKCPTGRYTGRNVVDAAARLLAQDSIQNYLKDKAPAILQDGLNAGRSPDNFPSATTDPDTGAALDPTQAPGVLVGPSTVTGSPTTTTTTPPGGSPTTSTSTPSSSVTYVSNTWNTTNTTTTNNGGTTTTTSGPPAPDPKTDCDKKPNSVGCVDLGNAPAQPNLYAKKTRTFTDVLTAFKATVSATPLGTAMGGFFSVTASGTCPVYTWVIPYLSTTYVFDLLCKPFFTAMLTVFSSVLMVVAAFTSFKIAVY